MKFLQDSPIKLTEEQELVEVLDKDGTRHVVRHVIQRGYNTIVRYTEIIDSVRAVARSCGYAIGVHGSLVRDIDLIAVPWTERATDAETLAAAITNIARAFNKTGYAHVRPPVEGDNTSGVKPHGRLCWTIHLNGGTYIDLSVLPRILPSDKEEQTHG